MSQQRILSKQNNLQNLIKLALFHIQQYQILFFYSSMHHSADPSTPAPKSKNTTLPPEITKHYNQHEQSNIFLCKYCHSNFILSSAHSIQEMIWHTQSVHQKQANTSTKRYTLEQKMDNLKPPPKYLSKYEHMDIISDRWLDRLIIDGYAVSQIMQNVFQRLAANSDLFLVSCQRRALKLQNAKPHIIQYIPYLPLHFLPDQSIHHLTSRFKVSYEGAGLLLKRHNWSFQKGAKMYIGLRNLNVSVKVLRENNNDAVVVFSSPRMKYLYSLYGDCVNLEYRFVPLKRSGSGMHYNIGLFLGQDSALRIILFGVALINGYCVKNVKASVQMFLQVMNFKCPETIVTDFSKTVIQSIDQIKKQNELPFKHMINWHYCTQKLKIDLANQPDYKECIRRLTSALSAITKSQYDYILRQLKNSGRIGLQKLAEFEVNSRRCCFAGGNPKFVGFGIQQDRVISVTKAIQTSFFYMNRLGLFYTLAFRLQNRWNSIVESNLTKSSIHEHAIAEIQYLSSKISRQVFSKLHSLYVHSLTNLQILSKHQSRLMYKIRDKSKSSQIGQYYVEYDLKSDCWRCNCLLIYWSGLPCEHLIKIVRFFEGSLAYYIGQRWRTGSSWGNIPAFESDLNDNSKWIIKQQIQSDDKIKLKSTKLEYPGYKKEKSTESLETKNGKYVHMVNKTSEIERSNLQESKIGGIQRQILINSID